MAPVATEEDGTAIVVVAIMTVETEVVGIETETTGTTTAVMAVVVVTIGTIEVVGGRCREDT